MIRKAPGLVSRYIPPPPAEPVIQGNIREATRNGEAISGTELTKIAYRGAKKPKHNTLVKHISNLNARLEHEGFIVESTTWYRLYPKAEVDKK